LIKLLLNKYDGKPSAIIAIIQAVQEHYHYLPKEVFAYLAQRLRISQAQIYSVATFYVIFANPVTILPQLSLDHERSGK
jgi:NADH-quinone oxidoreductase subunit E